MNKDYYVQLNIQDDFDKHIGVVKLNETDSIVLNINLVQNGKPFDISTASCVTMGVIKPDGNFNNGYCEIVDGLAGKIKYTLPVNCVNQTGVFRGEVQAFNNTSMISTAAFSYEVKNSLLRDEGVTTQPEYPILIQLIDDVQEAVEEEAGRVTAEQGRVTAETGRVNAESARVTTESDRASAETTRVSQENTRKSQETSRVSAESARVTAENARVTAENSRASAETTRQSNETARVSAETSRSSAENARATAETSRAQAESWRASAETLRVNAENGRVTAEAYRVSEFQQILDEWDAIQEADVRAEVIAARGGFTTLDDRLDSHDSGLIGKLDASVYTAADVLAKLLTVDGAGSGLDADKLGGKTSTDFVAATDYTAADVLAKLLTVDGAGSNLDADTIDGKHLSSLLSSSGGYLSGAITDMPDNIINIVGNTVTGLPTADWYIGTLKSCNSDTKEITLVCMNDPYRVYKKIKTNNVWQSDWSEIFTNKTYGAVITKSASATLALSDGNKIVRMTGASAQTITVPANSSVAFPIGTQIVFIMAGAGAVTFAPASGVTLESSSSKRTINAQHESATLIKTGTDTWSLIGALKA